MEQRKLLDRCGFRTTVVLPVVLAIVAGPGCSGPARTPRSASDLVLPSTFMGLSGVSTDSDDTSAGTVQAPGWWRRFGSPTLDALVGQAMQDSPSIRGAESRLIEATKHFAAQRGASRYPQVDFGVSVKKEQLNTAAAGLSMIPNPSPFMLYNSNVSVRYDFDFFGAQRHRIAAKRFEAAVRKHQADAARLTLAGNIVTAVIREGQVREEIELNEALLRNRKAVRQMLHARYENGSEPYREALGGDSDVDRIEAVLAPLRAELLKVRSQLAVYAGVTSPESLPQFRLSDLQVPQHLPSVIPSELVRRRPDILAAEASLNIAGELAGVATANLYPRIELNSSIGSSPLALGQLFAGGTTIWNIGAQLGAPLFHGGELRAARDAAYAACDAAFEDYQNVVLGGLQNVADTMAEMDRDVKSLHAYTAVTGRRHTLLAMASSQFAHGSEDRFGVLRAEYAYDMARLDVIRLRAAQMASTASFFVAVGGDADSVGQ
ncbi:efflux transporter outer membrane subunit [Burkholderia contaminans]|uniref:efflux transporter outer membrane subunit n=1 Tax=Burkholderia contaminans TaxID=488447 RepID=UPI0009F67F4A|nr:efflux transporter outer membrane subunit [Burkholderia contaminans]